MRFNSKVFYFIGILLFIALFLFLTVRGVSVDEHKVSDTIEAPVSVGEPSNPVVPADTVEETIELTPPVSPTEETVIEITPVYTYTEEELDLLARLIYSEGGIESYDTQLKIGSVVMNRVDDPYFPNTIREVIYQKNQFSVTFTKLDGVIMIDRPANDEAKKVALEILTYGSVLPPKVQVFYEKSITTGWVASRETYGTFDRTTFAYIYPKGEK